MLIQDYLDICDPVLTFDRFMGEISEKYSSTLYRKTQIWPGQHVENSFVRIHGEWLYIIA